MKIGLDIGSTTLKAIVFDNESKIIYKKYERHYSKIAEKAVVMLHDIKKELNSCSADTKNHSLCISGSAGMGIAEICSLPFIQEVYATRIAVEYLLPETRIDTVIELGGEDAKILFLTDAGHTNPDLEVRMNGSCAGGTGAFIDQMATLLNTTPEEMNILAARHEKIYTIASRCGVFAKSDIQPLLNQGAQKTDISASIFHAVVNQTIAGLAQGRIISGNVLYLGGPLTFLSELRRSFDHSLGIEGICPENSLFFVAAGAALYKNLYSASIDAMIEIFSSYKAGDKYISCAPLFSDPDDYNVFRTRHTLDHINTDERENYCGGVYIGIDAGSTTVKTVVTDVDNNIIFSQYQQNNGNAVPVIHNFLDRFYEKYPDSVIIASAVTGYGEDLIKNAFKLDYGVVETIAHFTAAHLFRPDVDFIIDIGGQDIKCFKIHNGVIDNIFLNEACSSGCGSFLQTFAGAWGMTIQEFAEKGIFADRPVDLGSRCTVFMNSSVKQAQKDGASIENISAGLSISVVKNALYKVIRAASADSLGKHIVVQGGTFLNDAVLRAFEKEIGRDIVRPNIAGLMGAFGCALYARKIAEKENRLRSDITTRDELKKFTHKITSANCGRCPNNCSLTINIFDGGRKYIGGNRCEKPLAGPANTARNDLNIYDYKRSLLDAYTPQDGIRGTIGIPMVLNMFELFPFWHTLFTRLGFKVVKSPPSGRSLYLEGQHSIPSDTVCYPAKLIHGHINALISSGAETIFYPCMTYNLDEKKSDNHYNCPVVAYYPEVIAANVPEIGSVRFIHDYVGIHRKKDFIKKFYTILSKYYNNITLPETAAATNAAYEEYDRFIDCIRKKGREYISEAKKRNMKIIILSGRPYHLDEDINHGIDKLICELGAAVISEDAISGEAEKITTNVLNQWTYHARLYSAAKYVTLAGHDINLVQLVSFGCGVDAITTDEVRSILEKADRIYTQIKIDEITNLGAVKIRLRSLFAALEQN